ncbi:hypothetical protein [Mesobacillus thioparans]|uniref:hypothetical protein n=1 Tax=Mesobacillus thioparans TaxID=370439 RepID=UPI0039F058C3
MKSLVGGLVSGIALGLFLKWIQDFTNLKVYTLLLNVDYVPIIKNIQLPEIIEFGLHLVISIMLALILNVYINRKSLKKAAIYRLVLRVSLIVGLLLYPSTLLSERTPSITDAYAFLVWMAGHWIYGIILGRILSHKGGERV